MITKPKNPYWNKDFKKQAQSLQKKAILSPKKWLKCTEGYIFKNINNFVVSIE